MAHDYYKILGVPRTATKEEIRKAYKKIARENHPDVKQNDPAAAERFKQANEAYEVLSDDEKRRQYDQFGEAWKYAKQGAGPFTGGARSQQVDIDLSDLFGDGRNVDLGDLFGSMFGGRASGGGAGSRAPRPRRGQDIKTLITVPFQLAADGGSYDVHLQRDGKTETLTVKIPAGLKEGGTIRLGGQGQPGTAGGPPGDLLITVQFAPHPYFRREGQDVHLELPLTVSEAALGAKVDVPTMSEGTVTLTIPPGTSSGTKLRLKGKGFPDPKTKEKGDQYVITKIVVPKTLSERERELFQELAELSSLDPRKNLWP